MAAKDNSSYTGRLKDEKKKLEGRVNELKEEVKILQEEGKKLQEEVRKNHDDCQAKINDLKEKIERLQKENNSLCERIRELETEIEDLKQSNTFLDQIYESIKQKNGELEERMDKQDEKLKKFELSEDELVIRQLCSKVQQNILEIVLGKHFDKSDNKIVDHIEKYISMQIEDVNEQKEADSRWKKLQKEIKWDSFWIEQLRQVKDRGNEAAHPDLTEEKIEVAKMNLKMKGVLGRYKVGAVDKLKDILKQTTRKLPHGTSSKQKLDQGGQRNLHSTGLQPSVFHGPEITMHKRMPFTMRTGNTALP